MNEKVKTFILFSNQKEYVDLMTDAQAGQLLKALYARCSDEEFVIDDPMVKMAFMMFWQAVENGRARREKLRENGSKGGRPKTNTKPNQNQNITNPEPDRNQSKSDLDLDLDLINNKEYTNVYLSKSSDFDGTAEPEKPSEEPQQGELIPHGDIKAIKDSSACPQKKIAALYAEILPELPQVRELRDDIQKNVRARWIEKQREKGFRTEADGLEYFRNFFTYVSNNNFLMGRADQNSTWRCDYRWLMKAANFDKVTSGYYARWQA